MRLYKLVLIFLLLMSSSFAQYKSVELPLVLGSKIAPASNVAFQVISTDKISIPQPTMTQAQIDALGVLPAGATVYNSTTGYAQVSDGATMKVVNTSTAPVDLDALDATVAALTGSSSGCSVYHDPSPGFNGGPTVVNTWTSLTYNTLSGDCLTDMTTDEALEIVTLQPGTWVIGMLAQFWKTGACQIRLRDYTAVTTIFASSMNDSGGGAMLLGGNITHEVLAPTIMGVEYWCDTANANGLGVGANTGEVIHYREMSFTKI